MLVSVEPDLNQLGIYSEIVPEPPGAIVTFGVKAIISSLALVESPKILLLVDKDTLSRVNSTG